MLQFCKWLLPESRMQWAEEGGGAIDPFPSFSVSTLCLQSVCCWAYRESHRSSEVSTRDSSCNTNGDLVPLVSGVSVGFQGLRIILEISTWVSAFLLWEAALLLLESSSLILIFSIFLEILKYTLSIASSFPHRGLPFPWVIGKHNPKAICLGWVTCWAVNEPAQLCQSILAMNTG